jgi:magnesium transporter
MLFANAGGSARTGIDAAPDAVWLDLMNATTAEQAAAVKAAGFELPTRDDIAEIESSSRVSTVDGVFYLNSPVSYRDADGRSTLAPVGFALSEHRLVTIRYAEMPAFDKFAEHFAHRPCASSAEAFAGLIEALVDRVADVLEQIAADLDMLSRQTFRVEDAGRRQKSGSADRNLRRTLTSIGQSGDAIGNLRDTLLGLTRIVAYTQQSTATWVPAAIKERLATVRQDLASLNDYDQQLTAKIGFLLDAVMGFISIEQNNIFKVLTIVSVVGIPPTFVVGLYGMNFKNMPEYDWAWGYQYSWVLIIVSIVVPLVWFRLKDWI